MTVARRPPRFVLARERPDIALLAPLDQPAELKAPHLHRVARKPQLAVRDSYLGRPPIGVDVGRRLPHWIPRWVATGGTDPNHVGLRARWVYLEHRAAQVVVIPIDLDVEEVRVELRVTTNEPRCYARGAHVIE